MVKIIITFIYFESKLHWCLFLERGYCTVEALISDPKQLRRGGIQKGWMDRGEKNPFIK